MVMKGLQTAAIGSVIAALVSFAAAWEAKGPGAQKYRETVKKTWYLTVGILTTIAGLLCGTLARVLWPLDSRPLSNNRSLKSYLYRRSYQGRHYIGVPLHKLLATNESNLALAA